jgi:subtilisin-like proprotein convertase family protein
MRAFIVFLAALLTVSAFGAQTASNPQPIVLPDQGVAGAYPSTILVNGFTGVVRKVSVTLSNVSHQSLADLTALLVGPQGRLVQLLSLRGGWPGDYPAPFNDVTWTFDDEATNWLYGTTASGTYQPTAFTAGIGLFPAPAPQEAPERRLSIFRGTEPNGVWSLYLYDNVSGNGGAIAGGWSLAFELDPLIIPTASNPNSIFITSPDDGFSHGTTPYPSTLTVARLTGVVSKVTVTLSNLWHASCTDLYFLLVAPSGQFVEFAGAIGEDEDNIEFETITFDDDAPRQLSAYRSGTFQPTVTHLQNVAFPRPAPAPPYATRLSALRGAQPNGAWSLYIYDNYYDHGGVLGGGWSVRIETGIALSLARTNGFLKLTWPLVAQNFKLQSRPSLNASDWQDVPMGPFIEGNRWTVYQPTNGPARYYRLFKP